MIASFIISMVAAFVIVAHGIFSVINGMTRCTPAGMRIAWIAITTGAMGVLLTPLFQIRPPTIWEAFLLSGVAIFVLFDRRRREVCAKGRDSG